MLLHANFMRQVQLKKFPLELMWNLIVIILLLLFILLKECDVISDLLYILIKSLYEIKFMFHNFPIVTFKNIFVIVRSCTAHFF